MARKKAVRPEMETKIEEAVQAPKTKKTAPVEIENNNPGLDTIPEFVEPTTIPDANGADTSSIKSGEPQDTGGAETESGIQEFANPTFEPDPKNEQIYALEAEVNDAAGGKPIASIVWQAKKKDGTTGGVSLKFYYDCKLKEIFNESDCPYDSLVSAPVSTLKPSATVAPVGAAKMKTKKCHNCN